MTRLEQVRLHNQAILNNGINQPVLITCAEETQSINAFLTDTSLSTDSNGQPCIGRRINVAINNDDIQIELDYEGTIIIEFENADKTIFKGLVYNIIPDRTLNMTVFNVSEIEEDFGGIEK